MFTESLGKVSTMRKRPRKAVCLNPDPDIECWRMRFCACVVVTSSGVTYVISSELSVSFCKVSVFWRKRLLQPLYLLYGEVLICYQPVEARIGPT